MQARGHEFDQRFGRGGLSRPENQGRRSYICSSRRCALRLFMVEALSRMRPRLRLRH